MLDPSAINFFVLVRKRFRGELLNYVHLKSLLLLRRNYKEVLAVTFVELFSLFLKFATRTIEYICCDDLCFVILYFLFAAARNLQHFIQYKTGLKMIARSDCGDLPVSLFHDPKLENDV